MKILIETTQRHGDFQNIGLICSLPLGLLRKQHQLCIRNENQNGATKTMIHRKLPFILTQISSLHSMKLSHTTISWSKTCRSPLPRGPIYLDIDQQDPNKLEIDQKNAENRRYPTNNLRLCMRLLSASLLDFFTNPA